MPRTRIACLVFLASATAVAAQPSQAEVVEQLKAGGRITLYWFNGKSAPPSMATPSYESVTDDDLRLVGKLSGLTSLQIGGKRITDAGVIASLEGSKATLQGLNVDSGKLSYATLRAVGGLPKLESLLLRKAGFTDAGLAALKGCPELARVELWEPVYTDEAIRNLAGVKKLHTLELWLTRVNGTGFAALSGSKELRRVKIVGPARLTEDGLKAIGKLKQLEELRLSQNVTLPDAGLAHLAGMCKLGALIMGETTTGDAGMKHLAKLPALTELSVWKCPVGDAGVAELAKSKSLRKLYVGDTGITDAGLLSLAKCKSLVEVSATRTRVTPEGVAAFQKALPTCKVITQQP